MTDSGENARNGGKRFNSWKEIAAHLGKDVRTVQRWEKNEGLPIHRKPHSKLSSVYAYEAELDAWWRKGTHPSSDVLSDRSAETKRHPRLLVLPLRNLSGDPGQDYFSEGMTEELIGEIGRIDPNRLRVIAHTSAMRYKAATKGIAQIAREAGVDYVLEGSVRRDGNRVRISVALIRPAEQTATWSQAYDRDLRDVLEVQAEVARAVAGEVTRRISAAERDGARPIDPEAYTAYLQGRFLWNRRTEDGIMRAIRFFEEATARHDGYALAYAGLADCYATLSYIHIGALCPVEAMPKAIAAARAALALDADLGEAHASLGAAQFWYEWDWNAAGNSFERALELNPSYASAHQWYAGYLQTLDQIDECIAEYARAIEVDPLSMVVWAARAGSLYLERQYDRVVAESRRVLELDSAFVLAYFNLGRSLTQQGQHREAIAQLKRAYQLSGESPAMTMQLGYAYAMAGKKTEAKGMLDALARRARKQYVPAFYSAAIHAGLRDVKQALTWLRKAHDERCDYMVHLSKEPAADLLRNEPEFIAMLPRSCS
jgi:TolB-like protein/Flp pilus assembly protein TadD